MVVARFSTAQKMSIVCSFFLMFTIARHASLLPQLSSFTIPFTLHPSVNVVCYSKICIRNSIIFASMYEYLDMKHPYLTHRITPSIPLHQKIQLFILVPFSIRSSL